MICNIFCFCVSTSGNQAIVSAHGDDNGLRSGSAYVFKIDDILAFEIRRPNQQLLTGRNMIVLGQVWLFLVTQLLLVHSVTTVSLGRFMPLKEPRLFHN